MAKILFIRGNLKTTCVAHVYRKMKNSKYQYAGFSIALWSLWLYLQVMRKSHAIHILLFLAAIAFLVKGSDKHFYAAHSIVFHHHGSAFKAKARSQVSKPVVELKKHKLRIRYRPAEIRFVLAVPSRPLRFFCEYTRRVYAEEPDARLSDYSCSCLSRGPPVV